MRGRKQHTASTDAIAQHNAKVFSDGVHRLWRAGLTDYRIGLQLGVRAQKVKAAREELGLKANPERKS
jgi:hypothetical protein